MISLDTFDAIGSDGHSGHASTITTFPPPDALVNRILDCADFFSWRRCADGKERPVYRLRKTVGGLPVGHIVSLRELHDLLFP